MPALINIKSNAVKSVLPILLKDRTTHKNIIWAASGYPFSENEEMTIEDLMSLDKNVFQPRVYKSQILQKSRTKSKAEVFTPSWLCNEMNNHCDYEWFGRENVFNVMSDDNKHWEPTKEKIEFPEDKTWQSYVLLKKLEITCGEAPFLVSRYDTTTGEVINFGKRLGYQRIGLLDRKLRVIDENAPDYEEWIYWVYRAFQSTYGYEWQGDSLLIARINLLLTFIDYKEKKWKEEPTEKELSDIATIISWNLWQMDGLKYTTVWNSDLEHKQIEEKIKNIKESIDKIEQCDFENGINLEDVAKIALYSGDIKKKTYNILELIELLQKKGYLPSIVESFTDLIPDVKVKPRSLQTMKKRQEKILRNLRRQLQAAENHKFVEGQDCLIHKWIPARSNLFVAYLVKFKDLVGDNKR